MMTLQSKVADASCHYDRLKPGARHRLTLKIIARRHGLSIYQLWNFRRSYHHKNRSHTKKNKTAPF